MALLTGIALFMARLNFFSYIKEQKVDKIRDYLEKWPQLATETDPNSTEFPALTALQVAYQIGNPDIENMISLVVASPIPLSTPTVINPQPSSPSISNSNNFTPSSKSIASSENFNTVSNSGLFSSSSPSNSFNPVNYQQSNLPQSNTSNVTPTRSHTNLNTISNSSSSRSSHLVNIQPNNALLSTINTAPINNAPPAFNILELGAGNLDRSKIFTHSLLNSEANFLMGIGYTATEYGAGNNGTIRSSNGFHLVDLCKANPSSQVKINNPQFRFDATSLETQTQLPPQDMMLWYSPHMGLKKDEKITPTGNSHLTLLKEKGHNFFNKESKFGDPQSWGKDNTRIDSKGSNLSDMEATNMGLMEGFFNSAHSKINRYEANRALSSGKIIVTIPEKAFSPGVGQDMLIQIAVRRGWSLVSSGNVADFELNLTRASNQNVGALGNTVTLVFEESQSYLAEARTKNPQSFIQKTPQEMMTLKETFSQVQKIAQSQNVMKLNPVPLSDELQQRLALPQPFPQFNPNPSNVSFQPNQQPSVNQSLTAAHQPQYPSTSSNTVPPPSKRARGNTSVVNLPSSNVQANPPPSSTLLPQNSSNNPTSNQPNNNSSSSTSSRGPSSTFK